MPDNRSKSETDPNNNIGNARPNDSKATSPTLIIDLKSHQPDAWRRLVELYGPLVYSWCQRQGLQRSDIEDVLQEVFRTVFCKIGEFQHDSSRGTFRGWLRVITRHKLGDYIKRHQAEPPAAGGSGARQILEQTPALTDEDEGDALFGEVYGRALEQLQSEVEPHTWQAFLLVVCGDRRPADVADQLGMTQNAVYLAKSKLLRRLREILGDV